MSVPRRLLSPALATWTAVARPFGCRARVVSIASLAVLAVSVAALALTALPTTAWAVQPWERLSDPALEARARTITSELRCVVCQNESVDESNADLAHDIRMLVRERLKAGDTNAQARQAVVDRYGDFVLLRPPVEPATYVLWFAPVALLLVGAAGSLVYLRRRAHAPGGPAPLDPAERARLDALLRDGDA